MKRTVMTYLITLDTGYVRCFSGVLDFYLENDTYRFERETGQAKIPADWVTRIVGYVPVTESMERV